MTDETPKKTHLKLSEAAELAGCDYSTVWRAVKGGRIPFRRRGGDGHYVLKRSDVEKWAGLR